MTITAIIEDILKKTHITIKEETEIKNQLNKIKPTLSETEKEELNKMIEVTVSGKLLVERKKKIQKIYPVIIEIEKKYEEEYKTKENKDVIDNNKTTEEVEVLLDEKIPIYIKYSQENPMEGVYLIKDSKTYRVQYENIDTKLKNLEDACQKIILKKLPKNCKNFANDTKIIKKHFTYQNNYFITYWQEETPYFDIQHIISVLNLKQRSIYSKYAEFKDQIKHVIWHKNEYGGYIERELIDEETTYMLILSSQSTISKCFKKDVAKILVNLRKEGKLEITNNSINLNIIPEIRSYKYTCKGDIEYTKNIIANFSLKPISKYLKKHVLYAFIITIPANHKDIIVKFGYTQNIAKRYQTIKTEYGSGIYIVGIKQITGEEEEQIFHKLIKEKYNNLMEPCMINKKKKTELYKLNPILIKEFEEYNPIEENLIEPKKIDEEGEELIEYIEKQKELFLAQINQFNVEVNEEQYEYLIMKEKTKQEIEKTKQDMEKTKQDMEKTKQIESMERTKQEIEKTKQLEIQLMIIKAGGKK